MTEDGVDERSTDYLIGKIEALEQLLRLTVATLSDVQREFVLKNMSGYANKFTENAQAKAIDHLRDQGVAVWDVAQGFENAMEDWPEEYTESLKG